MSILTENQNQVRKPMKVFCGISGRQNIANGLFSASGSIKLSDSDIKQAMTNETWDMVRLADMYHCRISPLRAMKHRAEVYGCTMPHTLIDTDGQFQFDLKENSPAIIAEQLKLGVPTTYNGKLLRQHRFFMPVRYGELTAEDYAVISKVFKAQRKKYGLK